MGFTVIYRALHTALRQIKTQIFEFFILVISLGIGLSVAQCVWTIKVCSYLSDSVTIMLTGGTFDLLTGIVIGRMDCITILPVKITGSLGGCEQTFTT